MTITFSTAVMEAMGFREPIAAGELSASFMSVTVYEVRGVAMPKGFVQSSLASVAGAEYRVALAESVNEGCQSIIGDDFDNSESSWREAVKSNGPFALIGVGPTDFLECSAGRLMREPSGNLTTYDGFPGLRDTLQGLEQRVLPPVYAALTCALSAPDRPVSLRKLARASVGRTPDGAQVHDIRMEMNADLYVSRSLDANALSGAFTSAISRAPSLNPRAARFFWLGAGEDDQVKRFLYFFLALEIQTHAAFARIDHERAVTSFLSSTGRPAPIALTLIRNQVASLSNLYDRFVWCTACTWSQLSEADVALFKELKEARDAIAHGRASEPPAGFARSAQLLAHNVLWP